MAVSKPVKMAKRIKPTLWANIKEICTRWSIGGNKLVMPHVLIVRLVAYPIIVVLAAMLYCVLLAAWGKYEADEFIHSVF